MGGEQVLVMKREKCGGDALRFGRTNGYSLRSRCAVRGCCRAWSAHHGPGPSGFLAPPRFELEKRYAYLKTKSEIRKVGVPHDPAPYANLQKGDLLQKDARRPRRACMRPQARSGGVAGRRCLADAGAPFAISGFIAAIIGGFGRPFGAFLGGLTWDLRRRSPSFPRAPASRMWRRFRCC